MLARDERFESDQVFCSNPACLLYVAAGMVTGGGNWAVLDNGAIIGRGRYLGKMYCDPCGKALLHPPIEKPTPVVEPDTPESGSLSRAG